MIAFSFPLCFSLTRGNSSQLKTRMLQQVGFRIEFAIGPVASWGNVEVELQNNHKRIFAKLVNLITGTEGGRALVQSYLGPPSSVCLLQI